MDIHIQNKPIFFPNKDFQTIQIQILFPFIKKEEEIAKMTLLPGMIQNVCEKYPTEEKLVTECEKNFILASFCTTIFMGDIGCFLFHFMIPDKKVLKKDYFDKQFQFFHEMMYHPKLNHDSFCDDEFVREVNHLKVDIEKQLKDTVSYAFIKSKEIVDEKKYFSNSIFNHQEQIDSVNPKNLYEYYCDKILYNKPAIYIFGNVNQKEMKEYCSKFLYYNSFSPYTVKTDIHKYLPVSTFKDIQEKSSFHNSVFLSYYKVKDMTLEDEDTLLLIKDLLSSGSSRLLNKRLRDDNDLVYSTHSFHYNNYGVLGICALIQKEKINDVKRIIEETLDELKNEEFIFPLLENIKERKRVSLLRGLDNKVTLFQEAVMVDMGVDISSYDHYQHICSITPKDIHSFLNRLIPDTYYFLEEGDHE